MAKRERFDTTIFHGKTILNVAQDEIDEWVITFTDGTRFSIDCNSYGEPQLIVKRLTKSKLNQVREL